jgi:hypothetical protein
VFRVKRLATERSKTPRQRPQGARLKRPVTQPCAFLRLPSPNLPLAHSSRLVFGVLSIVGYLLHESGQESFLKDPDMLKRLNDIAKMEKEDKNHILYAIDGLIKSVKLKNIAAL